MNNETLFLVIHDDNHIDPVYHLRRDKQAALDLAQQLVGEAIGKYGNMPAYSESCEGSDGWWFCESGEEHWNVSVREVTLQ